MKSSSLIFIFSLVGATYCAVEIERTVVSDAERAQGFSCRSSSLDIGLMRAGEQRTGYMFDHCVQTNCLSNGDISLYACGSVQAPEGCKLVEEISKPYPECCPKPVC